MPRRAAVSSPLLSIQNATLEFGDRQLWSGLNLDVAPHEFIAVIGSNGSGKTSLLRAILGQEKLTSGTIALNGKPAGHGNSKIGYIPQNRTTDAALPVRAKDLLSLGVDGDRFGISLPSIKKRRRIERTLEAVGATAFANKRIGLLSGGELQRVRVGQAVIGEPDLILADEPLSALDLAQQKSIAELLDRERREHSAAVLFVTHDVNPILEYVDRVLYLANGRFKIGKPDEVLRSEVLSELYGTAVDVVRNQGRIVVVGTVDHHHHPDEEWT